MTRLTQTDKETLRNLSKKAWVQKEEERSPVFVDPTLENNQRYCRWITEVSKLLPQNKPVRFNGKAWKL